MIQLKKTKRLVRVRKREEKRQTISRMVKKLIQPFGI